MLVDFYTEITGTGNPEKDFNLFLEAQAVLRTCRIGAGPFEGVHFDQGANKERCVVPFFGYSAGNEKVSPIFQGKKPEHGVARWFGGYASLRTDNGGAGIVFGTYRLPMKPIRVKGKKVEIAATVTICGMSCPKQTKHDLLLLLYSSRVNMAEGK